MNNADASILINDNEAQDVLNVDITDNGSGIKKRGGYSQFKTIGTPTAGVRGGYYYRDSSDNTYLIHANNGSVYKSGNSGAYSAFITTDTAGAYYDFTDSQGYLYRVNTYRNQLCRYDGTNLTYYASAPQGNQIEALPDRLVISGVSAYPNRVYFSGAADFTNFTTGLDETDPYTEDFGLPGQNITAIKYAMGRLFVWTKTTLSFYSGSSQYDGIIQDVTTTVGTTQPGSVLYDNGVISWQGQDKHFYSYDGNTVTKLSEPISSSVSGFVGGETKSIFHDTQTDFSAGTSSNMTTSEYPGFVAFSSSGTLVDDFDDSIAPTWTSTVTLTNTWISTGTSGEAYIAGYDPVAPDGVMDGLIMTTMTLTRPGAVSMDVRWASMATSNNEKYELLICTRAITSLTDSAGCYSAYVNFTSLYTRFRKDGSTNLGQISTYSYGIPSATKKNHLLSLNSSGVLSLSVDGTLVATAVTADTAYSTFTYVGFRASAQFMTSTTTIYIDNVYTKPSSGSFLSSAMSVGTGITGWWQFEANDSRTGTADVVYAIYTDTNTSIDTTNTSTYISSQSIVPPSIPAISTAPYLFWKANFSRGASTETASIDNVRITWNEGTPAYTFGTIDKDHRLIWSLAENNSSSNNASYIYDQRFDSWLRYSVPMDAPVKANDYIYFGGPSTGVVYIFPSGNTDNGTNITAYWKSKDFIGNDPFVEKTYNTYSLIAKTQIGSNVDLDIFYNGSNSYTMRDNISLTTTSGNPYIRYNARFPTGQIASFVNFKFGNDDADSPFEVYAVKYDYTPKTWRVME